MAIKPVKNNVIGKPRIKEATDSGIALMTKKKMGIVDVLLIGPDVKSFKMGDAVLLASIYAGQEVDMEGEKVLLFDEDDVIAIVE